MKTVQAIIRFAGCVIILTLLSAFLGIVAWYLPLTEEPRWRMFWALFIGGAFWLREFFFVILAPLDLKKPAP